MIKKDFSELTNLKKINVVNLDQLIESMSGSPKIFNFDTFMASSKLQEPLSLEELTSKPVNMIEECGTQACVAGWAAALSTKQASVSSIGPHSLKKFLNIKESFANKLSFSEAFYGGSAGKRITLKKVLVQLRELLKQALKAQDIELVKA